MDIPKQRIVDALHDRGQHERADWVAKELPDQVNTGKNAGLLAMLKLEPADLVDQPAR